MNDGHIGIGKVKTYLCPKHGKVDFHISFWHEESNTDETYCVHCILELLKEKLQPIEKCKGETN